MNRPLLLFAVCLCVVFYTVGCTDDRRLPLPADFDYGSWVGSTYRNDFFGFSITVPEDWYISEIARTESFIREDMPDAVFVNRDKAKEIREELNTTYAVLFHILRYSREEAERKNVINPNIVLMVESVGRIDRSEYVEKSRQNLSELIPSVIVKSETNKILGGKEFMSLEYEFVVQGISLRAENLISMGNGFALNFTLVAVDSIGKELLDNIMATLVFD